MASLVMLPLVLLIAAFAGAQDQQFLEGGQGQGLLSPARGQGPLAPAEDQFTSPPRASVAPQTFTRGPNGEFTCPHDVGFYPHDVSCDQYWACSEGFATLKTCGNGLAFQDNDPDFIKEECDYIYNVKCGARHEIAPPISTPECEYLHGVFPDASTCNAFWSCWAGEATRYECGPGLAYDPVSRICQWADKVAECAVQRAADLEAGGFSCPADANNVAGTFTRHPHPEDCRAFFVCFDAVPREYGCPIGKVFQIGLAEGTGQCADPQTVQGCENYYGETDVAALQTLGL